MRSFRDRIYRFMQGRYGSDELNRFMNIAALVLIILSFFGRLWRPLFYLYIPGLILVILEIFRMLSKNHSARLKELNAYRRAKNKVLSFFRLGKRRLKEKDYAFYKCPGCGVSVRVPRGKGTIEITCPRCRTKFVKRT